MRPTAAEIARTLVRGRLKGALRFTDGTSQTRLCHATDRVGRPMLLSARGNGLAKRLRASALGEPPHVWLTVDDLPPIKGSPSLGRVRVSGSLRQVPKSETEEAVLDFAESNPVSQLFDVGKGVTLHRMELRGVSLRRTGTTELIDLAEYSGADPDPLHECERELLEDLADHHGEQLDRRLRRLLADAGVECEDAPRVARMDRYGFVVDLGDTGPSRWVRMEFPRAARSQHDLAHLMHPLLFHHHHHHGPER